MRHLTFIQLHYVRSVGTQGTAHIMEDAIYGVIFSNAFSIAYAYGPRYELFKGFIHTEESEELGSIVNRFSAHRPHKSEV